MESSMKSKFGCLVVWSILMILLGMGIYKYREPLLQYAGDKYHEMTTKIFSKADKAKEDMMSH